MTKPIVAGALISEAVELACRAPSLHNSQPWRWIDNGAVIDLFADPHRIVRSTDSSGREALISCGAVLDHFRVAMAVAGWTIHVDRFPNPNRLDHLASIDFSPLEHVTQVWNDRAKAIRRRRTDRLPLGAPTQWGAFEPVLRAVVAANDAVALDVLDDDARGKLAEATRLTESLRRYDEFYHRELQWWTARFRRSDGVPENARVSPTERDRVAVDRAFPPGGTGERRAAITQDEAKILVLSTIDDTRTAAFSCGEALSAVLLECTMAGLGTCPLTHITEIEDSRRVIRKLLGTAAMPQILVRVGTAPADNPAPPTPRRPVTEVLEFRR
ncbi:Acg family FMN-binding oxidoreductase [Mycolicibacterium nivoides]|uniref:Acg family FMN-binding oxidoreductase n=1 Tax=Mycolicibacterium nivoides TaxID=2487344 RepID=A0ABW9LBE4_9MYCO